MLDFNYPIGLVMTSILIFNGHLYLCGVQLGVDLGIGTKIYMHYSGRAAYMETHPYSLVK